MRYGLVLEFSGIGQREYDAVNEKLGIDMNATDTDHPEGLISHAGGPTTMGLCVFEVWESKAAQQAFMSDRLGPALAGVGVAPPSRVTEVEVIGYIAP